MVGCTSNGNEEEESSFIFQSYGRESEESQSKGCSMLTETFVYKRHFFQIRKKEEGGGVGG
jgi:hypothetical protein